jgi:hypothetical protein
MSEKQIVVYKKPNVQTEKVTTIRKIKPRKKRTRKPKVSMAQTRVRRRVRKTSSSLIVPAASIAANSQLSTWNNKNGSYVNNILQDQPILSDKEIFRRYIQCLVENWRIMSRYPDSMPRKTATFTSISSFNVPLFQENGEFRFSMAVQPQMGDTSQPNHYQAAICNATTSFETTDWSQASSYLTSSNGRDPRIDSNYVELTQAVSSSFHGRTAFTTAGAQLPQPGANATTGQNFQGPNVANVSSFTTSSAAGSLNLIQNLDGSFTLPAGSYSITVGISFTAQAGMSNVVPAFTFLPANCTIQDQASFACGNIASGDFGAAARTWSLICNTPGKFYLTINVTNSTTYAGANSFSTLITDVMINPTNFALPGPSVGAVSLVRPVAQTILVSYMGPTLLNGGRIVGGYVPKGALDANFFTPAAGAQGNYQMVENLANVSGTYDGQLKNGCFGFWTPYDQSDTEFRTVGKMNSSQWPSMVVSGVFNPVQNISGNLSDIVRVRLITTFEMITQSTAFEQRVCSGSQNIIDRVNRTIGCADHFMANNEHETWIQKFLNGVMKYGPAVVKAAEIGGMMLL